MLVVTLSKDEDGGVMVWIQRASKRRYRRKTLEEQLPLLPTINFRQRFVNLLPGAKRQTGVTRYGDVVEMTQPMMPQPMMRQPRRQPMIPSLQDKHTHTDKDGS
jgi:hypothetical protein